MSEDYPFGFEKPKDSPGFLLWQATTLWQRQIKKVLEPYNLSHAQFVIMAVTLWFNLSKNKPNQNTICEMSKLDKMTVSKSLKKLVKANIIRRYEDEKDTRAKILELTQKGKDLTIKIVPLIEAADSKFFGKLSNKKSDILKKLLNDLNY